MLLSSSLDEETVIIRRVRARACFTRTEGLFNKTWWNSFLSAFLRAARFDVTRIPIDRRSSEFTVMWRYLLLWNINIRKKKETQSEFFHYCEDFIQKIPRAKANPHVHRFTAIPVWRQQRYGHVATTTTATERETNYPGKYSALENLCVALVLRPRPWINFALRHAYTHMSKLISDNLHGLRVGWRSWYLIDDRSRRGNFHKTLLETGRRRWIFTEFTTRVLIVRLMDERIALVNFRLAASYERTLIG